MDDYFRLIGTTLAGKYAIERVVSAGKSSVVYRALHLTWRRPVALKVFKRRDLLPEVESNRLLAEFVREGAILAELSERSAGICQARDIGALESDEGDRTVYTVLEWLDGETLERLLADERRNELGARTPKQALRLLEPVAEALALAHSRGLAHLNVSPAGIFVVGELGTDTATKLLHFRIARMPSGADAERQFDSFTHAYGAPEQFWRAHGELGPRTDVFALALVFSELLAGRQPFDGPSLDDYAVASMSLERRPTPRTLGASVSDEVEAVFEKALSVRADERYRNVGELWNALRVALSEYSVRELPVSRSDAPMSVEIAIDTEPGFPRASSHGTITKKKISAAARRMRSPWFAGTTLGALIVACAFAGAALVAIRERAPTSTPFPLVADVVVAPALAPVPVCPSGMVFVPATRFSMGAEDDQRSAGERPVHDVSLNGFCIDKYEVTTKQYLLCHERGPCTSSATSNAGVHLKEQERKTFDALCNARDVDVRGEHPINCVEWEMASQFCLWAHPRGRLPAEAEWELASRGGDGRKFAWGNDAPSATLLNACDKDCALWEKRNRLRERALVQTSDGFATTAPVGSFPAGVSPFGLEDTAGNVSEWTADLYAPSSDIPIPSRGASRIVRGGGWNGSSAEVERSTFRQHEDPATRSSTTGFRCAADPSL